MELPEGTCELCEEQFAPKKCLECFQSACQDCTFDLVNNLINQQVKIFCEKMSRVRLQLLHENELKLKIEDQDQNDQDQKEKDQNEKDQNNVKDQEFQKWKDEFIAGDISKQRKLFSSLKRGQFLAPEGEPLAKRIKMEEKKIDFESTFEYQQSQELLLDEFQADSKSIICIECKEDFLFKVKNSAHGLNIKTQDNYLLKKTKFTTMDQARNAHGSFQDFLATQAGFESLEIAKLHYLGHVLEKQNKKCQWSATNAIEERVDDFTALAEKLKNGQIIVPEYTWEYWFLKVVKLRLEKQIPTSQTIKSLAKEWELDKYFDQTHGQVYWTSRFKQHLDKLKLNDM